MDAYEQPLLVLLAILLTGLAVYFGWRQRITLRNLHTDLSYPPAQRHYLLRQVRRRLFGSLLLLLLAALLIGSLFLDYDAARLAAQEEPIAQAAKQSMRFLSLYWMTTLLLLMVILAVAVFDLWATARFGYQQQKQLAQEHQYALEAELGRLRQRRPDGE